MIGRSGYLILLGALWCAAPAFSVDAEAGVVWRLGKFDHSGAEFGEKREWPAMQAGSQNAKNRENGGAHAIRFRLAAVEPGAYALEVAVLLGYPRVPYLQVELNGATGLLYLNRELSYRAAGRMDSPVAGEARERIAVPAGLLKSGENELRITAVDDEPDENGDSWIEWDALEVVRGAAATEPEISARPTVFYTAGSAPKELIEVTIAAPEIVRQGSVTMMLAGERYTGELKAGRFGQQRFEFAVPEFSRESAARILLEVNGRKFEKAVSLSPRRKFTVYVVPNTHLDIGFTDYQPKIEELQNRNLDKLLSEMRGDADMRFSLDGSWLAEQFLRTRSAEERKSFLNFVRAGKIAVPAQSMNLMAGGASMETLLRSLLYGQALNREAGRAAEYANITDVPSYPWAYASALHAAGVKYFAAGANDDRGPQPLYGRWQTRSPFWWEGPDGGKVLMSYNRQYSNLWFVCGLPAREAGCRASLPAFLETYENSKPDTVLMYGSQLENTDLIPGEGRFVRAWNARYAWPKLQLATFADYFHLIEQKYGDKLETVRGDFGPYWEDGIGTDARFAAEYRAVENRAPAVEMLSSIAALQSPEWAAPADRLHRLWNDLVLYAEHTYTYYGGYDQPDHEQSVRQIETKHFHVSDAREQAHWIAQESFSRLLDRIAVKAPALAVFNSLGHARDGLVELDLASGSRLVDIETRRPVPVETLREGSGFRHVRFVAAQVPSAGYRVYEVDGKAAAEEASSVVEARDTIENSFYRVKVNTAHGGVESIFDKQLGRELIDPKSPYLADQYVYVSGGEGSRIVHMRDSLPDATLKVTTASTGKLVRAAKTNWGQTLAFTTSGAHAPAIETEIRLFDGAKRIEFVNRFHKEPVNAKEAIYFAFPFAVQEPAFAYEGQAGVVEPARDELAGGNREWYTAGRWMRVSGGGMAAAVIPLDAPLAAFGDINRGLWPRDFKAKPATLFSYVLNNYWHTNFPRVQEGDMTFRYVVTSGAELSDASLSRLSREALTPLEIGQLNANDKVEPSSGRLDAKPTSFLQVDGEAVEIDAFKPAEDGNGYILRLQETGGKARRAHVSLPHFEIQRAWECEATEGNSYALGGGSDLDIDLPAYGLATVRLMIHPGGH